MSDQYTPELLRQLLQEAAKEQDSDELLSLAARIANLLDQKKAAEKALIASRQRSA